MKNIAATALLIAATFVAAGPVHAQDHLMTATVPFSFTVGDTTLPSGNYTISSGMNQELLAIRNWDKKVAILSLGRPGDINPRHENSLVFHKYGNQYFLSDVRSEQGSMNIHYSTTKAEKRAKSQVQEAGLFVDDPVLIALR